jgi:hypothetical protein
MANFFSTQDVARLLGVQRWQIQRIYENGVLPEPQRFAGKRMISGTDLPPLIDALRTRGFLPDATAVEASP